MIGAHKFEELRLINRLFPSLQHIYLFEPQAEPLVALKQLAERDSRIKVFPCAVSDTDGVASFNVASNDGESSSLLKLGTHRELFPEVTMKTVIEVPTRRLDSVLTEHGLANPDVMIVDVQGAEYLVLKSFSPTVLDGLRLLYTEVSTEALYESAGLLSDVEALLASRFVNLGFAPMRADVPMHGNAVFVARADADVAVALKLGERFRRAFHRLKRRLRGRPGAAANS
ncbi:MAG: FkbM family methyltransferase [Rhizobacter sp.]|nr:FkbM family methyltransferase [Rhizobacter sp.]